MSQANRALCYLSVMVGQCVAQSGTKRFCEEATKQKVELGTEQNRTEGKVLKCGLGVEGWGGRQRCKVIRSHAHSGMQTKTGEAGPRKVRRPCGHQ